MKSPGGERDQLHGPECRKAPDYSHRLHVRPRMLHAMSTTPESEAERSADEVNEEIRDLWFRAGGTLTMEERLEYQRLVMEWSAVAPHPTQAA